MPYFSAYQTSNKVKDSANYKAQHSKFLENWTQADIILNQFRQQPGGGKLPDHLFIKGAVHKVHPESYICESTGMLIELPVQNQFRFTLTALFDEDDPVIREPIELDVLCYLKQADHQKIYFNNRSWTRCQKILNRADGKLADGTPKVNEAMKKILAAQKMELQSEEPTNVEPELETSAEFDYLIDNL